MVENSEEPSANDNNDSPADDRADTGYSAADNGSSADPSAAESDAPAAAGGAGGQAAESSEPPTKPGRCPGHSGGPGTPVHTSEETCSFTMGTAWGGWNVEGTFQCEWDAVASEYRWRVASGRAYVNGQWVDVSGATGAW